jgi:hypothetical protein
MTRMIYADDDDATGAIVRPFVITNGRTQPRFDIAIEALVVTTPRGHTQFANGTEQRAILSLCGRPQSMAEIAALTRLPFGIARVIVSDLITAGMVALASRAAPSDGDPGRVDILHRVLAGLRTL